MEKIIKVSHEGNIMDVPFRLSPKGGRDILSININKKPKHFWVGNEVLPMVQETGLFSVDGQMFVQFHLGAALILDPVLDYEIPVDLDEWELLL